MGGDSGRGNTQNMNMGSGNNAAMGGQAGHHKRDAAAPRFGGGMGSSGGQSKGSNGQGSGFFGKFGWGKRSTSSPANAGAASMGQGSAPGMAGGSAPARGMRAGGQDSAPGSSSGGFFNKAFAGWKRYPQDASADTPGGAQGRPWGKRQADTLSQANDVLSRAGAQLSGTATKTKVNAAAAASGNGAPAGTVGYAGNAPSGSAAAAAAATPKASGGSAGPVSGAANDMIPDLGSQLGSAPAAGGAGNMAGAGDMPQRPSGMAGDDMAGSGGWGDWMKKFAGGAAGFR